MKKFLCVCLHVCLYCICVGIPIESRWLISLGLHLQALVNYLTVELGTQFWSSSLPPVPMANLLIYISSSFFILRQDLTMSPRYVMTFSISSLALAHLLGLTPTGPLRGSEGMKKGQTHGQKSWHQCLVCALMEPQLLHCKLQPQLVYYKQRHEGLVYSL